MRVSDSYAYGPIARQPYKASLSSLFTVLCSQFATMHDMQVLQGIYRWDYMQRLHACLAVCGMCGIYLHFCIRRLAPGFTAMAASVPVVVLNTLVPLVFKNSHNEVLSRATVCVAILFLGNVKVLPVVCTAVHTLSLNCHVRQLALHACCGKS